MLAIMSMHDVYQICIITEIKFEIQTGGNILNGM